MKYFKIIFLFVCFIATCFVLWKCTDERTPEQKVKPKILTQREDIQNPCETGSMGNCSGPYLLYTTTITLDPPYSGCTFDITYKARSCNGALDIIFLYYEDFGDPSSVDPTQCPSYQADVEALDYATNPTGFELWQDNFENKLAKALAAQLLTPPACGGATPPIYVSYITGSCSYICSYYTQKEGGKRRLSRSHCADICCEQKYSVCNLNGTITFTKIGSTQGYGTCPSATERICPDFTVYRSQCLDKCRFNF